MIKFKQIIIVIAFISLFLIAGKNSVKADEYMTGEQIEQVTQGLKDDQYVLTTAGGGIIVNKDGSKNFPLEQVASEGQIMTVAEYKQLLATQLFPGKMEVASSGTVFLEHGFQHEFMSYTQTKNIYQMPSMQRGGVMGKNDLNLPGEAVTTFIGKLKVIVVW